jgi:mortality factor 4-like protein 1
LDDPNVVEEMIAGLRHYFNRALGVFLLYRFERQQFAEIQKSLANKDFASAYGAEHLLRLCGEWTGL